MTLTVNAITGPSVLTMSPNPGTQTTQPLTFTFTDPSGGASITTASVLVNTSQSTAAACYVQYTASTQTLQFRSLALKNLEALRSDYDSRVAANSHNLG